MAHISVYEATRMDEQQITDGLRGTDHYWVYNADTVTPDNADSEAEVMSVFVNSNVTRQVMERMPRLRLIATRSTGFDHIDLDYARERGIAVVNVPTYGENTVAEYAFSLLLSVVRKLIPTVTSTEDGTFYAADHVGVDLKGKTFGIIGMGRIGQHTARIAKGFGMEVIACDHHERVELAQEIGFSYRTFDDIISKSDVVSLHVPLTSTNYHMINQHTIARMKRGVILINTARGELVENRALILALQTGRVAGAGIDTLEGEHFLSRQNMIEAIAHNSTSPSTYEHATENYLLLHMPNVVITQHAAFNTREAIKRINDTTTQNIIDFWYGSTPNQVAVSRSSGKLIIVRHGQSEWNALGKWTGTTDVHITQKGVSDSAKLAQKLQDISFDYAYTSQQIRTKETLEAIMNGSEQLDIPYEASKALNERDYGVYTGMNKKSIQEIIGEEAYNDLRRSWDGQVEGGESLEDVYQRTIPFYLRVILPRLRHGQNILIVAHGNSIRSLVKYIENISDEDIGTTEMIQGAALCYEVNSEGRSKAKSIYTLDSPTDQDKEQ